MLILAVYISGSGQSLDCTATAFSPTAVLLTWNSGNIQEIENTENFTVRESGNLILNLYESVSSHRFTDVYLVELRGLA